MGKALFSPTMAVGESSFESKGPIKAAAWRKAAFSAAISLPFSFPLLSSVIISRRRPLMPPFSLSMSAANSMPCSICNSAGSAVSERFRLTPMRTLEVIRV